MLPYARPTGLIQHVPLERAIFPVPLFVRTFSKTLTIGCVLLQIRIGHIQRICFQLFDERLIHPAQNRKRVTISRRKWSKVDGCIQRQMFVHYA